MPEQGVQVRAIGESGIEGVVMSPSVSARSLWAKSDYGIGERWLPLFVHLQDTMGVVGRLWDEWLPSGTRDIVCRAFEGRVSRPMELARSCVLFMGAVHDVGKATPVFQAGSARPGLATEETDLLWRPRRAGLPIELSLTAQRKPTHAIAGQVILEHHLTERRGWSQRAASSLSSVVGAHHGRMPKGSDLRSAEALGTEMGWSQKAAPAWRPVQEELVEYAFAAAGLEDADIEELGARPLPTQVLSVVSGLVIMADWIASNQDLFPLLDIYDAGRGSVTREAWRKRPFSPDSTRLGTPLASSPPGTRAQRTCPCRRTGSRGALACRRMLGLARSRSRP